MAGEDTVDLGVVEERAGLRDLCDIHYVGLAGSVVSQYQVTPRLYLLVPCVTVGLYGVERRELILPGPLEPSRNTRRHCIVPKRLCLSCEYEHTMIHLPNLSLALLNAHHSIWSRKQTAASKASSPSASR